MNDRRALRCALRRRVWVGRKGGLAGHSAAELAGGLERTSWEATVNEYRTCYGGQLATALAEPANARTVYRSVLSLASSVLSRLQSAA